MEFVCRFRNFIYNVRLTTFWDEIKCHHIVLYLLALGFCMRYDVIYCNDFSELILHRMPLQILCLMLGVGLEFVVRENIEKNFHNKERVINWCFFSFAYIVLITTGILWSRYIHLSFLVMYSVIIGLLKIIEKYKIGVFASEDKTLMRKILFLVFAFFIIVDMAYEPMDKTKQSSVKSVVDVSAEQILENNAQNLKSLNETRWKKLSVDEKLDVLQTVVNVELNHLGIDHEIKVQATPLGKNTNACYSPKEKSVNVNIKRLEYAKGYEMLTSVAHESFHAYQIRMVEAYKSSRTKEKQLLYFRKLEQYDSELNNYVNGKSDYEAYYNQTIEIDARAYGKERATYYYNKLNLKN